jgi:hypothetical protein
MHNNVVIETRYYDCQQYKNAKIEIVPWLIWLRNFNRKVKLQLNHDKISRTGYFSPEEVGSF